MASEEVSEILRTATELRGDIAAIRADHRVTALEAATAEISARADLIARMDRLQGWPDGACADPTMSHGAGEQAERLTRNATEETRKLSDMTNAMQRQVRCISARTSGPQDEAA